MKTIKQHIPKILLASSAVIIIGVAFFSTAKLFALRQEVSALKQELHEKTDQIARMQDDLGKEVSSRNLCESSLSSLKDEIASSASKLEAFALQAASCEQLRRKLKK